MQLTEIENYDLVLPQSWSEVDLREAVEEVYCLEDIYALNFPPKFLVFYSTRDRDGAEKEKDCIEEYCSDRQIMCEIVKDPTKSHISQTILSARNVDLSSLVVFVMSHGKNGEISVEGCDGYPEYIKADDIISDMHRGTEGKPKVRIVTR